MSFGSFAVVCLVEPQFHISREAAVLEDQIVDLAVRGLTANETVPRLNRTVTLGTESLRNIFALPDVPYRTRYGEQIDALERHVLRNVELAKRSAIVSVQRSRTGVLESFLGHELLNLSIRPSVGVDSAYQSEDESLNLDVPGWHCCISRYRCNCGAAILNPAKRRGL